MILLTSNGLSSFDLLNVVQKAVKEREFKNAVIVVTADHEYKDKNWNINRLTQELNACGLSVDLFDFDIDSISVLNTYDVIEFNGGNPFYLLSKLKEYHMQSFLEDFLANNKIIIGISAGSLVLQKTIDLVNEYSSDMNFLNLKDLRGMNLVDIEVLPHYSKFINVFDRFEERCQLYENTT